MQGLFVGDITILGEKAEEVLPKIVHRCPLFFLLGRNNTDTRKRVALVVRRKQGFLRTKRLYRETLPIRQQLVIGKNTMTWHKIFTFSLRCSFILVVVGLTPIGEQTVVAQGTAIVQGITSQNRGSTQPVSIQQQTGSQQTMLVPQPVGSSQQKGISQLVSVEPLETVYLYGQVKGRVPVVTCIDFDPSGRFLAIGGDDHFVRVWDLQTRKQTIEQKDQIEWIRGIAFSNDQKYLIALGQDAAMSLYLAANGAPVKSLQGRNRGTQSIVFRPGKKEVALCGFENEVPIYNVETGQLLRTLKASGTNNRAIRFSPDGSLLVVAGRTGFIRVWNVDSGDLVYELAGDGRRVNDLAFNADGTKLAVGGEGPNIMIWSMKNGKRLTTLPERAGKTYSLAFCGDDVLASGESDNTIRFWNLQTGTYYANTAGPKGHSGTIATLVYEQAQNILASGSFDTTVRLWPVPQTTAK